MDTVIPNPGSDEAIDAGCTCPIVCNYFGKGKPFTKEFIYDKGCLIHKYPYNQNKVP